MRIYNNNRIKGEFIDFMLKQPLNNSEYVQVYYDMSLKLD